MKVTKVHIPTAVVQKRAMDKLYGHTVYHLDNGKPSQVYHGLGCRCLDEHGPYRESSSTEGKRPCGYCGGMLVTPAAHPRNPNLEVKR